MTTGAHTSNKTAGFTFVLISIAIIALSTIMINSTVFGQQSNLISLGITLDLTLGIPLVYYFLISRKLKVSSVTVLVVFLICIGIASLILPAENQLYLNKIKNILIITELILFSYLIIKAKAIISSYKKQKFSSNDFILNIRSSFHQVMGINLASSILASEISMLRYGLLWWRLEKETDSTEISFSTHQKSGYVIVWSVFIIVILIETALVHLLLWRWNIGIAIAATSLSVYGLIFFVADLASLIKRPVAVTSDMLFVRVGIRWNSTIDLKNIKAIEIIKNFDMEKEPDTLDCSIIRDPNLKISLYVPATVHGLYGIRKNATSIAFNIDDEVRFITIVKSIMANDGL